jgi:hypothetical protein
MLTAIYSSSVGMRAASINKIQLWDFICKAPGKRNTQVITDIRTKKQS